MFGNLYADHVCDVWRLLRVNSDSIVNRRIRRDNNNVTTHHGTMARLNASGLSAFNLGRMSFTEDPAAVAQDCLRQTGEICEWMKLCLPWEPQGYARVKRFERRS